MALTNGPNLGLLVNGNAGEGHYTDLMKQWRGLDGLVMPNAKGYLTNTPPGSPADGDLYIIGAAPTGAWAGQGGKITRWSSVANAWEFYTPKNGWTVQSNSAREVYRYTGGAWEIFYQEGTYTPSWTASGTAPAIGNGTISGSYIKAGKKVTASVNLLAGSTTTFGTGKWFFSLPTSVAVSYNGVAVAERYGFGFSGGFTLSNPIFAIIANGPNEFSKDYPHVWAVNDRLYLTHTYKEA